MSTPPKPDGPKASFSGLYTGTFLAIGVALGAAFKDLTFWMLTFLCIGVALDFTLPKKKPR